MKRSALLIGVIVTALYAALGTGNAQTAPRISDVTIPFGGTAQSPQAARELMAAMMKALLPDAASVGATAIHLQSTAYTLTPEGGGYSVNGNLFIDVVPEEKTAAFVALRQKKGAQATINYFQACR